MNNDHQRDWFADTLAKRLFLLMWAALVASHLLAWTVVTWGPEPGPGAPPMPTFPALPPTPGLGGPPALPTEAQLRARSVADLREMNALIDQALALFRGQASGEAAQRIDLTALLQSLCDDLAEQGQAAGYQGMDHAVTRLPPQALRRVLDNLIGNALRYGGAAEVTLAAAEGGWLICIADRGPGIPDELLAAVFEPFFRVEGSRNRDTGGTGLGLYIASDLTRLLGGRLSLHNRPEGGLSARLWLPQA